MADQTEKPKLGTRPPLGLKRTVETGKVKQSFSHGRSNTVVVEVKKRRILGRPGEAPPQPAAQPLAEAPKPTPKPPAPAAKRPEPARPSRGRGDEHRHRGKLTVTRALSDEDDSRARSLAALRRAREKEKRHHMEVGPSAKQVRDVVVPEAITVQELANRMAERGADLVKALFKMGSPVTLTQTIDQDTAELLVTEFVHRIKRSEERRVG